MEKKSSLRYYRGGGGRKGQREIYNGSYGSDLLFRARVGALDTRRRLRWQGLGEECRLCGGGTEDLEHVMLRCGGLEQERLMMEWEDVEEGKEMEQVRFRLGIGREGEGDGMWIEKAKRYLMGWRRKGGGG